MRLSVARLASLSILTLSAIAVAQQPPQNLMPQPRISSIFPAGAKAGTTVEVVISGTDLEDAKTLLIAHPGIRAELIAEPQPTPDPKTKQPPAKKRGGGMQITTAKFKITIAPDVPPGSYDLRVVDDRGVSNPRLFTIGILPEITEKEPNNDLPEAQPVELGTVINGTFANPTDVDYVRFTGKAGQRFIATIATSSIESKARPLLELYSIDGQRLGSNRNYSDNDALLDVQLPSDGDYFLRVSEFAYLAGGPDYFYRLTVGAPYTIDAVIPPVIPSGQSTAVTLYGRNLPGGKPSNFMIAGRPIDQVTVNLTPPSTAAIANPLALSLRIPPALALNDAFEYRLPTPNGPSAPIPLFLTDLPVVIEQDSENNTLDKAQEIPAPGEVVGRIEKRLDRDFYGFSAKKGETFEIELFADRVGSNMDTYFQLRNAENQPLGPEQDDNNDPLHPVSFFNRTGDPPPQRFTAPADGKFYILVGSHESAVTYGPRAFYRLRISRPTPDFRAIVMPRSRDLPTAAIVLAEGDTALDIFVDRRSGFSGPVTVTAENLPPGVTAKPTLVGNNSKWGTLILTAAADAKPFTGPITIQASATVDGTTTLLRTARPASITWATPQGQNNVPAIVRLDQQLILAVRPTKASYRLSADTASTQLETKDLQNNPKKETVKPPFYVKPGDKLSIPIKVHWQISEARANAITVQPEPYTVNMNQAPVAVANVTIAKDKNEAPIVVEIKPNTPPGTYVIALRGETQHNLARDPEEPMKKSNLTLPAYVPEAIVVTVIPSSLAKVTAQPPPGNALKPGTTAELLVKVQREAGYPGPYQITLEFPQGTTGLSAPPVTIPAGQSEAKIPITATPEAKVGPVNGVVVAAVGTLYDKVSIRQETKVNLNVAKPDAK